MRLLYAFVVILLTTIVQALPSKPIDGRRVNRKYIFASFTAVSETTPKEKSFLDIYTSSDGINFEKEFPKVFPKEDSPLKGLLRDPSIIEYWGKYYVTYTTGWSGSQIGIISSPDLENWTHETTIDIKTKDFQVYQTWAPVNSHANISCGLWFAF